MHSRKVLNERKMLGEPVETGSCCLCHLEWRKVRSREKTHFTEMGRADESGMGEEGVWGELRSRKGQPSHQLRP
jgi:hypothetical protein